jgi:hypothetical protein
VNEWITLTVLFLSGWKSQISDDLLSKAKKTVNEIASKRKEKLREMKIQGYSSNCM